MLTKILTGISLSLLMFLGVTVKLYLDNRDRIVMLTTANELQTQTINTLQDSARNNAKEQEALQDKYNALSLELKESLVKLDDYKEREHVAKKKPEAVKRLANAATKRLFLDWECATGRNSSCRDNKN